MALLKSCTKPSKYVCTFTISWRVDGVLFKSIPRWRKWIIHYALPLNGCWWPDHTTRQVIAEHGIGLALFLFVGRTIWLAAAIFSERHRYSFISFIWYTTMFYNITFVNYSQTIWQEKTQNSNYQLSAFRIGWLNCLLPIKTLCFDIVLYRLTNLFLRKSIIPLEGKICPQDIYRLHVKFLWKSSLHLRFRISVYTMPGHDLPTNSLRYYLALLRHHTNSYTVFTLIARFMGSTWGPSGADKTHVGPCWPHELCYLGTSKIGQ